MNLKHDLPIRSSEMGVLIFVKKQNSEVRPLHISQFFKITKPSVTTIINSLVKAGYLFKEPSKLDKRSYILKITSKGNKLLESTFKEYYKSIKLLSNNMGEKEFNEFIRLMQIANNLLEELE